MFKRILTIPAIVLAVSGLALAANTATITTTGSGNTASATQSGDLNIANIEQIANNSVATQIQIGLSNTADLDQKGGWPPGSTVVTESGYQQQVGNNNQATLWQLSDGGSGENNGLQFQEGTGNIVIAWQHTIHGYVEQTQLGTNNQARIYQVGFNNYAKQLQEGVDNWANIDEQAGGWTAQNKAVQEQGGYRNKSLIAQYGTGGNGDKTANGNEAYVTQYGEDNWAGEGYNNGGLFGIFQAGDYNYAAISQTGIGNHATITQNGDGNYASQIQNGIGHSSTISQTGYDNSATVVQNGP